MVSTVRPVFVLDSSVAVKWYVEKDEPDVAKALRLIEVHIDGGCRLKAPSFLLLEVLNALTMGRKLPAALALEALEHLKGLSLDLEDLRWPPLASAIEVASACGTTLYDSYFLALALESGSVLVTADEVFLRRARRYPNLVSLRQLRLPD